MIRALLVGCLTLLAWYQSFTLYRSSIFIPESKTNLSFPLKSLAKKMEMNHSFAFIQLSDIHISKYKRKGGIQHLNHFLSVHLPLVAPELVVATGDLTDAKAEKGVKSGQVYDEWVAYHKILQDSKVLYRSNSTFWFDQRGNHDCFNVPSFAAQQNKYRQLSAIKDEGYRFVLRKEWGNYTFIGLDACPDLGVSRPLNFFGYLDRSDMDFLEESLLEPSSHIFVMSHYPTATMSFGRSSNGLSFSELSDHFSLWLCGHLHKLVGSLGESMYAFHNFLELELGDLKMNAMYRIIVVDNDLISFRDISFDKMKMNEPLLPNPLLTQKTQGPRELQSLIPPLVLISSPKDAKFLMPEKEPLEIMKSSDIRVFVWSIHNVTLQAYLNGELLNATAVYRGRGKPWGFIDDLNDKSTFLPLWTIQWTPPLEGELTVVATDALGQKGNHSIPFNFQKKRQPISGSGNFIISLKLSHLIKDLLVVGYILLVCCLLLPYMFVQYKGSHYDEWSSEMSRQLIQQDKESLFFWSDFKFTIKATFLRFCELCRVPSLFYPIYGYLLYMTVGPLLVGDFIPSAANPRRYAWLMVYGLWFQSGEWIPCLDAWLFSFHSMSYCLFPLVFYLSFCVTLPDKLYHPLNPRRQYPIHERWYVRLIVVLFVLYHIIDTFIMSSFYSSIVLVLSPSRSWVILWGMLQLYYWRNGPIRNKNKTN